MALSDKNIVITPNIGQSADPTIVFSGADSTTSAQNIALSVYPASNGTLSFDGSAGQLFSITNSLTGSIFSVNDISGIPSIEVLDTGVVKLAQYGGNVGIGVGTPGEKLEVSGNVKISGTTETLTKTSTIDGWTYSGKSISVSAQETASRGLSFSTDGTKMYIVGQTNDTVYQYTLSTPFDVSTATYASKSFSVLAQDTASTSIFFKSDGLAFYMLGDTVDTVFQYTLSTAWDVSTATYATKSFSVTTQETAPSGLEISPDGTKMYVIGTTTDTVYQYTLSTAWDVSTAAYATKSFSVTTFDGAPTGIEFNADGTKMYVVGTQYDCIIEYTLSTAWDVSTANFTDRLLISNGLSNINPMGSVLLANSPHDIYTDFSNNVAYIFDLNTQRVFQYTTNTTPLKVSGNKLVVSPFTYFKNDIQTLGSIRTLGALEVTNAAILSSTLNVGGTLTASGTLTATSVITLSGATTSATTIGTTATTGTTTIGGTSQTGLITLGQSTATHTLNIDAGATISGATKTINIGTGGVSGSTTNITLGSATGTTTNIYGWINIFGSSTSRATIGTDNSLSLGRIDNTASSPYIDFNSGSTTVDYDTRIMATAGNGTAGNGTLGILTGAVGIGTTNPTAKLDVAGSVKISQDLSVSGNVYISGNTTVLSSNNLVINDSIIYLANNNPANLNDIGFVGNFTSGSYQHTGLVRDAHDGVWKLFSNVVSEPTNTVDFTSAVYDSIRVGNVYGTVYGNANTATALQTSRLINGTSFNGSADVTILANTFNDLIIGTGFNPGLFDGSSTTTLTANTASTTGAGIVQLTDSVSSTSTTTAATPNSVKLSYDQATNAFNKANTAITLGSTPLYLGSTNTTISGLTSVTSTFFVGNLYGNANTATTIAITPGISGNVLTSNGTSWVSSAAPVGFTTTDDNSTNATYYPVFVTAAGGSTAKTASTDLTFNPSTGTFSAIIFNSLSDANKKENIQTLTGALEKTLALRGVSYNLIDSNQPSIGLIAQEAEEIIPEVVCTDPQGNKSITYGNIIGLLVEAIKEQHNTESSRINTIENEITEITSQINNLNNDVKEIKDILLQFTQNKK